MRAITSLRPIDEHVNHIVVLIKIEIDINWIMIYLRGVAAGNAYRCAKVREIFLSGKYFAAPRQEIFYIE